MDTINILLATFNGEKYLREQLNSIANQTYTNWFLIVHDDQSNDSTNNILFEFKNRFPTKVVIKKNSESTKSAKNNFFSLINSKKIKDGYIMFCDQDDVWLPNKIELTLAAMKKLEKDDYNLPCLIYTDSLVVNENLQKISDSFFSFTKLNSKVPSLSQVLIQNNMAGCTAMINQKLYKLLLKTKDFNNILMHDWWILLLALTTGKVYLLDIPTLKYRQHSSNSVGASKYGLQLFLRKIKERNTLSEIKKTMKQAKCFVETYDYILSDESKKIITLYATLTNKCKMKRVFYYLKYGYLKYGILRKVGQIFYG